MPGRFALLIALLFAVAPATRGQTVLTLKPVPDSRVEVDGTSNRSTWTVAAQEVTGTFTVAAGDGLTVEAAEVHVPSNSMKSERGIIMDRLMKGALKVSQFGDISFVMADPANAVGSDTAWTLVAPGRLTIAGQTHDVDLEVVARAGPDGTWRFTGSHRVTMSEYGMKPPTAMFGALVTGDDVVVRFDVVAVGE